MAENNGPVINKGGLVRRGALGSLQNKGGLLNIGRLTDLIANTWKMFYSDGDGDVQELALGADGTVLKGEGASTAPTFGIIQANEIDGTAWRAVYINGTGDVAELTLGAAGTYLRSAGAAAAPTFAVPAPTELTGTAWRIYYANGSGVVSELALGSSGQVLVSNGASSVPSWQAASGAMKVQAPGYFMIPTGPALGTTITSSASANTYGSYAQMIASTSAALYIVGFTVDTLPTGQNLDYAQFVIATGGAGSESAVGEVKFTPATLASSSIAAPQSPYIFPFPIPVATSTRIAVKVADDIASALTYNVTLQCVAQSDLIAI